MEQGHSSRTASLTPWALCVAVMLAPALLVWIVRLTAFFLGCAPGPGLCRGLPLGAGLRDALNLSWVIATSPFLLGALGLLAMFLAFRICRPLMGTLSLLLLPILSPILPILAVLLSRYEGCAVSSDGLGSCQLWGAAMGMSFHNAAIARDVAIAIFPYTFSLTVMLGLLGFFFARPKPSPDAHPMAQMRHRLGDDEDLE
jgi:hypothetical protein